MRYLVLISIVIFSGFSSVLKAEGNYAAFYVGRLDQDITDHTIFGLSYENRFSSDFSFTLSYDTYDDRNGSRSLQMLGINYYPISNIQLGLAYGSESGAGTSGTGLRAQLGYVIDFDKIKLIPSYRKYSNATELGIAFQFEF